MFSENYEIKICVSKNMTREQFLKAYSNVPADERNQIFIIIDNRPYTWNNAYDEIKANTELGKKILKKINELKLL